MKMINYLLGYENLKIVQDPDMFKFSLDSILLANFATINRKFKNILDIGTGNAPIPLVISTKTKAHIDCIEIQKQVYNMGVETIDINNLTNQISIYNGDVTKLYLDMPSEKYDLITCNPPYFKITPDFNANKNDYKTIARHEVKLNLEQLMKISRRLLKNGGLISIVHRPERLVDILIEMRNNNIEPKKIQFVYPKKGEDANILLIEGSKNGKSGLKMMNPLYVYDIDDEYTEEIKKIFT